MKVNEKGRAKALLQWARQEIREEWRTFVTVTVATGLTCFSVVALTMPYQFAGTGVTGIALITHYLWGISPAWVITAGNGLLLLWSWKALSLRFALWTAYVAALTSLLVPLLELFQYPTVDNVILAALLGGVVGGLGFGLLFREGASSGGTDVIVVAAKRRWGVDVGAMSFYLNVVILMVSLVAVDLERILMGGLLLYVETVTIDNVIKAFDRRTQVLIVSNQAQSITEFILGELDRSATILPGKGAYSGREVSMVLVVLTRRQAVELKRFVASTDPQAFLVLSDVSEVVGLGFKGWNRA